MKLKYAALALLLLATPWRAAAPGGEDVSEAVPATEALVTIQRLILGDGSEVCLDALSWLGTPPEYFEHRKEDERPSGGHAGRIALPYSARLANGAVLEAGWYSIHVDFNRGEILFTRVKGMQLLQSAYKDLSADIEYRISHADTDGDGSISQRERSLAFWRPPPAEDGGREASPLVILWGSLPHGFKSLRNWGSHQGSQGAIGGSRDRLAQATPYSADSRET